MTSLLTRCKRFMSQSKTIKIIAVVCTLISVGFASHAAAYTVEDAPDWVLVKQSPVPNKEAKYLAKNGVYYRIFDKQINAVDPLDRAAYTAWEYELTNQSGVTSKSTIEIDYDPNYESVVIHELGIIRNGQYLDRLTSTTYEQLRTERQLDELFYNGTTTLAAILEDVRVGDVIRHSYTIKGSNPVFEDIVEYGMATQYYAGLDLVGFRLLTNARTEMFVRKQNLPQQFKVSEAVSQGIKSYSWSTNNPEKRKYLEDEPVWTEFDPAFSISSIEGWHNIVSWSQPHYNKPGMRSEHIKKIALTIKEQHDTEKEYVGAALQWVQDEVRYFGVELGTNSHNPSHPDETLSRRFGDCKDKALLLIAILDELGIDAQPALVNTSDRLRREDYIYRLHAFDHVIVHIEIDDIAHWIDPTRESQMGKLGDFYEPDYGMALIIDDKSTALTSMANSNNVYSLKIHKQLTVSTDSQKSGGNYTVRTERSGVSAEKYRRQVSDQGIGPLTDNYLDYYRGIYGAIASALPLRFTELPRNKNHAFESYELNDVWDKTEPDDPYFEVSTEQIQEYLVAPNAPNYRERAFYIGNPVNLIEKTTLHLPGISEDGSYSKNINNDYFDYSIYITQRKDKKSLTISHTLKLKSLSVKPEDVVSYVQDTKLVDDLLYWDVTPVGLTWSENGEDDSSDQTISAKLSQLANMYRSLF